MPLPPWLPRTLEQAKQSYTDLLAEAETEEEEREVRRRLALGDLFYLLVFELHRPDMVHPWIFARCREVQADPDGYLDLWAREHYKSTIITFGLTIQDILTDPEETFGIFSHTRPNAKAFLRQIKVEFETNADLKWLFPEILWADPHKESPKWSEDEGIVVKRKGNPKEATIEAWGLVDGQPTSKHFGKLVYDDVVTRESVTTPEMIRKTTNAYEMSDNLGAVGGKRRIIGTRYHLHDTYKTMMDRKIVKVRKHPATDNGKEDGKPVLLPRAELERKRRTQHGTFHAQMLLNPRPDDTAIFLEDDFIGPEGTRRLWPANRALPAFEYIIQSYDSAFTDKTTGDPTACTHWGVFAAPDARMAVMLLEAWDENYSYPDLRERVLKDYRNTRYGAPEAVAGYGVPMIGGEAFKRRQGDAGRRTDVVLIEDKGSGMSLRQDMQKLQVPVVAYNPGRADKVQRAHRVAPLVENGLVWLPEGSRRGVGTGEVASWARPFLEQVCAFPVGEHDDYVDTMTQTLILLHDQGWLIHDDEKKPDVDADRDREIDREMDRQRKSHGNPYAR